MELFSNIFERLHKKKQARILILGLSTGVGKTTILYVMKHGVVVQAIHTCGFNVETVEYNNICFTFWDIGGGWAITPLWRHYYPNTQGIIFVVDSSDIENIQSASNEFRNMLFHDDLKDVPVLVLANKQDLPNAMTPVQISERLGLHEIRGRQRNIVGTCATRMEGIMDGLNWLSHNLL